MLIRKLSAIAAICGFCTVSSPAMAEELSVKEMLLKQQQQIEALQNKIAKQEAVHNEALTHYIKNEVDRALADHSGSLLTLGSNVENLTFKGDLRVRWENQDRDYNGKTQDRFRQRFRLGMLWKTNEGWEIGAGLATGEEKATTTNDTYSDNSPFETGDIRLDYAYAKHKFDNGASITLGQHKNPYLTTDLFFDSDIRPTGVTAQYSCSDSGFFATAGAYEVFNLDKDDQDSSRLFSAQAGISTGGLTAALAYFHFNSATAENKNSTTTFTESDNDYNIIHGYAEYAGKTDSFGYKVYGEYFLNIGAEDDEIGNGTSVPTSDNEDEDAGYVLGAEISVDKMKFAYEYAHMEGESMYSSLMDADFGDASNGDDTNKEGHTFKTSYKVTKNFSIGAKYIMSEEIDGDDDGELLQVDFKYKF